MTSQDARRYFATDGSIFSVVPSLVVYPRNEQDVRKAARFTWQLAERGRVIPLTARGAGTDQAGAALGSGIMLSFPAHMNRIVEFDSKTGVVVAEPGTNYAKLQQTLHTHARFLPPYPASFEYSTIGGAVGNNASGEKTIKYGDTSNYVRSLRVVLANGEVIETTRLSKKELGRKLGLATFEGEIYRALDAMLEENRAVLEKIQMKVTKNSAGYNLLDIKRKDGSFDLTPLIVGSQGTLGIVSEITFETEGYNPQTTLLMAEFEDINTAQLAVTELRQQDELPCAIEMVDKNLLQLVDQISPNLLKSLVKRPFPGIVLLVEFDNGNERLQAKLAKKATKIFDRHALRWQLETDRIKQEELWKIRHSSAIVLSQSEGNKKALPVIEDGIVPVERLHDYIQNVYQIFEQAGLQAAVWGHAGDANIHMQPYFDLSQVGDRQKIFKLMDEYYHMVISLGGTTSGEHNDGRLRAPYLPEVFGAEVYALFQKLKLIFDPYGTMNPGVKINVALDDIKPLLRSSYSLEHLYNHMPRS